MQYIYDVIHFGGGLPAAIPPPIQEVFSPRDVYGDR